MTLCVVRRRKQQVQIATDSRLNLGEGGSADIGVKLMALPLRLYEPRMEGDNTVPEPEYSRTLGLATVGSVSTTYIAKQLLETVLSSLQFVPGVTDISMRGIAEVCARVLRNVSRNVCKALAERGEGQLVLVGRCLATEQARVFILTVDSTGYPLDVVITEFTEEDEPRFLGSGAHAAERASSRHSAFPFHVVREVIRDPAVKSVGGNVQFGVLDADDSDFRIRGVCDYRVDHDRRELYVGFYLGGLEILGEDALLDTTNFSLMTPFLDPARQEINRLFDQRYDVVDSTAHWDDPTPD
jgi:hypothetical protein